MADETAKFDYKRSLKSPMKPIMCDMPESLLAQLDKHCAGIGERRNPTIRQAIREYLEKHAS